MGLIRKSLEEHEERVRKLRIDINEEVEQISSIVNSTGDDECDLYYLYFKLTQLNYVLTSANAKRNTIPADTNISSISMRVS